MSCGHQTRTEFPIERLPRLTRGFDEVHRELGAGSPGAIVSVLLDGEVVLLKGYGLAQREFHFPWSPAVRYTFYSLTKPMVAAVYVMLAESGQLSLDEEIQKFLPDFPRFEYPITLRHLLTHTSGLWQDETLIHLAGVGLGDGRVSLDELYELMRSQPLLSHRPGTCFYYNDGGLRLLARALERVAGCAFGDAMRKHLFEPAGMRDAGIKAYEPMWVRGQAPSYLRYASAREGDLVTVGTLGVECSGDGGAFGSILDLIAFARFLEEPRFGDHSSLLDRLSGRIENEFDAKRAYRMCIVEAHHRGLRFLEHSGLYGKTMIFVPAWKSWILCMRNAIDSPAPALEWLVPRLLDAALGSEIATEVDPALPPYPEPAQRLNLDECSGLCGRYVEPDSGFPLEIWTADGYLKCRFLGLVGILVSHREGSYRAHATLAAPEIELSTQPDGLLKLRHADWSTPRVLQRVRDDIESSRRSRDYCGRFVSDALGVMYTVRNDHHASLLLGVGSCRRRSDLFRLVHLSGDLFEGLAVYPQPRLPQRLSVSFQRSSGAVCAMRVSTYDCRGLELRRVASGDSAP